MAQSEKDQKTGLTMKESGRGAARAEDAQETPTQSHKPPSILVYEDTDTWPGAFVERLQRLLAGFRIIEMTSS